MFFSSVDLWQISVEGINEAFYTPSCFLSELCRLSSLISPTYQQGDECLYDRGSMFQSDYSVRAIASQQQETRMASSPEICRFPVGWSMKMWAGFKTSQWRHLQRVPSSSAGSADSSEAGLLWPVSLTPEPIQRASHHPDKWQQDTWTAAMLNPAANIFLFEEHFPWHCCLVTQTLVSLRRKLRHWHLTVGFVDNKSSHLSQQATQDKPSEMMWWKWAFFFHFMDFMTGEEAQDPFRRHSCSSRSRLWQLREGGPLIIIGNT